MSNEPQTITLTLATTQPNAVDVFRIKNLSLDTADFLFLTSSIKKESDILSGCEMGMWELY